MKKSSLFTSTGWWRQFNGFYFSLGAISSHSWPSVTRGWKWHLVRDKNHFIFFTPVTVNKYSLSLAPVLHHLLTLRYRIIDSHGIKDAVGKFTPISKRCTWNKRCTWPVGKSRIKDALEWIKEAPDQLVNQNKRCTCINKTCPFLKQFQAVPSGF